VRPLMSNNRYDKIIQSVDSMTLPDVDFTKYYQQHHEDNSKVKRPVDFLDRIMARMNGEHKAYGTPLPWGKTHQNIRFRPAEVTMWSGYNGHRKSMVLGYAALGFIRAKETVCIASLEMEPAETFLRMYEQATGLGEDQREQDDLEKFFLWTDHKLWLYDHVGSMNAERLYGVIFYAAKERGVKHFIIDSLMRIIDGEQGIEVMNAQKNFVTRLCEIAKELDIHIHFVHHMGKPDNESKPGSRYNAKGSGAISDNIHNSIVVWSNKDKENKSVPDVVLICDKQRNGEWEGQIPLWFREECIQFISNPTDNAWRWL
jgi:twinkle protein